jgi:hypothetical protein
MGLQHFPLLNTKASCFVPQGKLVQLLRNVQTEQFSKLQQRYQLQIDLLEDVRYVCSRFDNNLGLLVGHELTNISVSISGLI